MKLIRDRQQNKLILVDDSQNILLELGWMHDEFVWVLNSNIPIIITQELDEFFYNNLQYLMNSDYEFFIDKNLSYKTKDEIKWLSDQYVDLEDKDETDKINRLIIRRRENEFNISAENPFCEENGIEKKRFVIAFSPSGNGYQTRNIKTNISFQSDIISLYLNTLNRVKINVLNNQTQSTKKIDQEER